MNLPSASPLISILTMAANSAYQKQHHKERSDGVLDDDDDSVNSDDSHIQWIRSKQSWVPKCRQVVSPSGRPIPPDREEITVEQEVRRYRDKKKTDARRKKNKQAYARLKKRQQRFKSDMSYFQSLSIDAQDKMLRDTEIVAEYNRAIKPVSQTILETDIPLPIKSSILKKIWELDAMSTDSTDYYKQKAWVDAVAKIPFGQYREFEGSITQGVDASHAFLVRSRAILDKATFGMEEMKARIIQMVGQLMVNPSTIGCTIGLKGEAGTGKTTIAMKGIAKIFNRPFCFLGLGGSMDAHLIEGQLSVFEGSTYGYIVSSLIHTQCMNPIFFFDELDKLSDGHHGADVANVLMKLTDSSQNQTFYDRYFPDIPLDLSRALFIFSYNDESKIHPVLLHRMYKITASGYKIQEKISIARLHLIPEICENLKFAAEDVVISNKILEYICNHYCEKEGGVRNLKRAIETIYAQLNLYRLMHEGTSPAQLASASVTTTTNKYSLKVTFPFTVTVESLFSLLPDKPPSNVSLDMMYGRC